LLLIAICSSKFALYAIDQAGITVGRAGRLELLHAALQHKSNIITLTIKSIVFLCSAQIYFKQFGTAPRTLKIWRFI